MTRIQRVGKSVAASLEKDERTWLFLFVIGYLTVTAGMASRPFWYDELITYYMSRLPSWGAIWAALRDGVDLNPPVLYMATRAAHRLFGTSELATRVPAIAGFLVMCLCIYWFVARRCPKPYAFAAMLVPVLTSGYRYAAEARSYGLEFGFLGIAVLAWQDIGEPRRRPLRIAALYFAMALALLTHCYAVIAVAPIALAEAVRNWTNRKIDWPVWLCFAGLSPIVFVYLPLFAGLKQFTVTTSVLAPAPLSVPHFYAELLKNAIWPLIAAALLLNWNPAAAEEVRRPVPHHEIACGVAFALAPLFAFILAATVTHVFMERYGMASMIGFAVLAAFYLAHSAKGSLEGGGVAVAVLLVWMGLNAGAAVTTLFAAGDEQGPALATVEPDLPIVVSNGLLFLDTSHYQTDAVAARMHFLVDEAAALRYTHSNVFDLSYPLYQKHFHIRGGVDNYREFLAAHSRFLVYGTYDHPMDWLIRRLRDEGVPLKYRGHFLSRYGDVLLLEADQSARGR